MNATDPVNLGDEIRLFPAWPVEWDVDFKRLSRFINVTGVQKT